MTTKARERYAGVLDCAMNFLNLRQCEALIDIASEYVEPVVTPHGGDLSAWPIDDIDDLPGVGKLFAEFQFVNHKLGLRIPMDIARFGISRYTPGNSFRVHVDDEERGARPWTLPHRGISCSVQLSPGTDYEGGDLEVSDGLGGWDTASRRRGAASFFGSSTPHGVTPVTAGERWVLLGWAYTNHDVRPIY